MTVRFTSDAARALREAIHEAGGVEVFAIGHVERKRVTTVEIACRGQIDAVPALLERPRTGQVVIHNHPSGDLRPSDADMALAARYGDDGVGVVIVNSTVDADNWVVEPHAVRSVPVTADDVERVFHELLPRVLPGFEAREAQLDMARHVAASLSDDTPLVCEAGTGTGKSLAYLVPAALWALANDSKVIVSTHTKALQDQLLSSDLPLLKAAGLAARVAALKGRGNYLCKRRLELVAAEERDPGDPDHVDLNALVDWARTTASGLSSELQVSDRVWEQVESDPDLTLRVRCPHYASCHYYVARREAAGAHIVVVNHALLLADRVIRDAGGGGVIPTYHRVILDEAHHLERAATGAIGQRLGLTGIRRAIGPLLTRRRRGALERLVAAENGAQPLLDLGVRDELSGRAAQVEHQVQGLRERAAEVLATTADALIDEHHHPRRLSAETLADPAWSDVAEPGVVELLDLLDAAANDVNAVLELFDGQQPPPERMPPLLDLKRSARRFRAQADTVRAVLAEGDRDCRWVEANPGRDGSIYAQLATGPIDVAPTLRRILWDALPGTTATSATLTVANRFEHWQFQVGLDRETPSHTFPSPFNHERQALLAVARDLPDPAHSDFMAATSKAIVQAVRASGGGAFVLCTSYAAVDHYTRALRAALPASVPVLAQRGAGQRDLVERFRSHGNAVLVGTDSFWEGVDVRGDALRLVIIPRLPFRVPTDPIHQARHERLTARGVDPFRNYTLPEAALKLKQGYGRLLRSTTDRGVVLLLDRRLHDRTYGRVLIASLPPARRLSAPWERLLGEIERFFR